MGDILFVLRMAVYTVIVVLIMQVKIGPQTVEDRVIEFTHKSQFSSVIQNFAQGAVTFIGNQYNNLTGKVNSKFFKQHSKDQVPGHRLKAKMNQWKDSFENNFKEHKEKMKKNADEVEQDINNKKEELESDLSDYEI